VTRVPKAARLQLIHPLVILGVPWLVGAISFVINVAIWGVADPDEVDGGFTGGLASL